MKISRVQLSPALHRAVEKAHGRPGLSPRWWQRAAKESGRCPRCGEKLIWRAVAAEGRSRFVCSDCGQIFYHNPKLVAATVPVWKGKVVLLRRAIEPAKGLWSHPAGFMELGETVEEAAKRETLEEICCRVRLLGAPRLYSYADAGVVTVVYLAEVVGKGPRPGLESLEVVCLEPKDIPWRELAFRSTYHALRDVFVV